MTCNYRSRPQVLAAMNHLFGDAFGDDYQPLAASSEFSDPVFGHPVELLVTDKSSFVETSEHWRTGEARRIAPAFASSSTRARPIRARSSCSSPRAPTRSGTRRRSGGRGSRRIRTTGRGYFGQQQVVDLLAYLRLLHNRYDDVALATVLASPFVGVSNDALVLVRRNAPRRPLFTALERTMPEQLAESDERLLRAFLQRYERLVRASTRVGLEELCERIVTEHDYDLAVLARWDGARRFANIRKLGRLARDYEAVRASDVEGFVRFVREQDALGAKELEAVAEEEGGGAVRLLTIHAAKGLEFKVVIVADAGRDTGGPRGTDEIVALSDGRFGFRMVHPTRGDRQPVFGFEEVRDAERDQERAERLRLYYVAMTRAIDRLIVSGAIDPARTADRSTPIGWVLDRLDAHETVVEADETPIELDRDDARFVLTVNRFVPELAPAVPVEPDAGLDDELQLALFDELPIGRPRLGIELPPLAEIAAPTAHDVRRLSYSALALFERCSYRYFAERVLGLPFRERVSRGESGDGLAATEIGDAVHRLLELVPLDQPAVPPRAELERAVREWYPEVAAHELERIAAMVDAYCRSELAQRIAGLRGARPERPFTFEHDGVVIRGRLDVLWRDGPRAVVVDYKSNALEGRSPAEIIESEYSLQRLVYALVCLRAGAEEVEVAYQFLERPDDVASTSFTTEDVPKLESDLSAAIARIREGDFRPTPSEFACSDCPALDLLCAGPRLGLSR